MKKQLFRIVRGVHHKFKQKELPERVGLYMHAVENHQIPLILDILKFFADHDYQTVNTEDFLKRTGKCLFLSFDDNHYSWLKVIEEFYKRSITATFYINTAPLRDLADQATINQYFNCICHHGTRVTLSSRELQLFIQAGCVIGGHTHRHLNLAAITLENAKNEILINKKILEDYSGSEVSDFSYPFGMRRYFSEPLRKAVLDLGFSTIANAIPGQLFREQKRENIYRTLWNLALPFQENLDNIAIDGRIFEALTGFSPIG